MPKILLWKMLNFRHEHSDDVVAVLLVVVVVTVVDVVCCLTGETVSFACKTCVEIEETPSTGQSSAKARSISYSGPRTEHRTCCCFTASSPPSTPSRLTTRLTNWTRVELLNWSAGQLVNCSAEPLASEWSVMLGCPNLMGVRLNFESCLSLHTHTRAHTLVCMCVERRNQI